MKKWMPVLMATACFVVLTSCQSTNFFSKKSPAAPMVPTTPQPVPLETPIATPPAEATPAPAAIAPPTSNVIPVLKTDNAAPDRPPTKEELIKKKKIIPKKVETGPISSTPNTD